MSGAGAIRRGRRIFGTNAPDAAENCSTRPRQRTFKDGMWMLELHAGVVSSSSIEKPASQARPFA